jgi:hypothetical protein
VLEVDVIIDDGSRDEIYEFSYGFYRDYSHEFLQSLNFQVFLRPDSYQLQRTQRGNGGDPDFCQDTSILGEYDERQRIGQSDTIMRYRRLRHDSVCLKKKIQNTGPRQPRTCGCVAEGS